jgi:hypothetical protein
VASAAAAGSAISGADSRIRCPAGVRKWSCGGRGCRNASPRFTSAASCASVPRSRPETGSAASMTRRCAAVGGRVTACSSPSGGPPGPRMCAPFEGYDGGLTFHAAMTGRPCSVLSRPSVPVASWNNAPFDGGSPSHRAVSTRRKVAVCHQDDHALGVGEGRVHLGQHAVGALAHLLRALPGMVRRPGRDPVGEQEPVRPGALDLDGRDALVAAVVPLAQIHIDADVRQPDQLGGLPGPLQGADERGADPVRTDQRHQPARFVPPLRGQRDVGPAGVPPRPGPFGLSVPYEEKIAHSSQAMGPPLQRREIALP